MKRFSVKSKILLEDESGHALYELALLLPLLLLCSLAALEFSRGLRYAQLSAKLSNELARNSYQECANLDPLETLHCLNAVREPLQSFGQALVQDTSLVISVYEWTGTQFRRVGISPQNAVIGSPVRFPTKFTIANSTAPVGAPPGYLEGASIAGNIANDVVQNHRLVVVSEAYVPFESIVTALASWIGLEQIIFYEAVTL